MPRFRVKFKIKRFNIKFRFPRLLRLLLPTVILTSVNLCECVNDVPSFKKYKNEILGNAFLIIYHFSPYFKQNSLRSSFPFFLSTVYLFFRIDLPFPAFKKSLASPKYRKRISLCGDRTAKLYPNGTLYKWSMVDFGPFRPPVLIFFKQNR